MNMKYEIIIFDSDETLFDFKKAEKVAFKNTILEFQINYEENYHYKVYKDVNTAIWAELEKGLIAQENLNTERFKRFANKLNITFDAKEFGKTYMKHLGNGSFLLEDSLSTIENLYKNYRLTIITNGLKEVQRNRIGISPIAKYFEDIVISEEVKVAKPNPKIFEIALSNINFTDKSKVLMVGDSLTSDIKGGINFGIDTCWFNPSQHENTTEMKPTFEISSLLELKDILSPIGT